MAYAVGLTPIDLEQVGRDDAAVILAEIRGAELDVESTKIDRGRVWFTVPPDLPDEDREAIRRWAEEWAERLDRTRQEGGDSAR
ncbi:hypothetical protein [Streptosporangium sp. CA-115845]|uniref:hypothetical protein n=1 Tax=Streptosporangium sp. CA-115845 TaxID=3240071 RepID=UPI003D9347AD